MSNTEDVKIQIKGDATGGVQAFTQTSQAATSTVQRIKAANDAISESTARLTGMVMGLSTSVAAASFMNGVRTQLDLADAMDETAQKAGIATDKFSELAYAGKFAGLESGDLVKALVKVNDATMLAASGDAKMKRLLVDTLQVQVRNAAGEIRNGDDVLMDLIGRISSVEDPTLRSAAAIDVFGAKLGPQLLPLINLTRKGVEDLRQEAHTLGVVISNEAGAAAGDLKDNLDKLRAAQDGVYNQIMQHMLPGLLRLSAMWLENARTSGIFKGSLITMGTALKEALGLGEMNEAGRAAQYSAARVRAVVREIERLQAVVKENPAAVVENGYGAPNVLAVEKIKQLREEYTKLQNSAMAASDKVKALADSKDGRSSSKGAGVAAGGGDGAVQAALEAKIAKDLADNKKKQAAEAAKAANELRRQQRDAYEDRVGQLRLEFAAWKNNTEEQRRIAQRIADEAKAMFGAGSREYAAAQAEIVRIDQRAAEQRKQIQEQLREGQMDAALALIDEERAQADQMLALGLETVQQRLAQEVEFERRAMAIKREALMERLELIEQDPDRNPVERARVQQQLEELERQHLARMGQIKREQEGDKAAPGMAIGDGLERDVTSAATSLLTQQTTLMESLKGLWRGGYNTFVEEMISKPLAAWVAGQARMTLATLLGVNTRVAAEATGAAMTEGVTAASVIKIIAMKAWQAAASVYAAIAGIPYIGPFLAPAMAVGAVGAVLAMAGNVFSAAGGFDIPTGVNPMVQAHAREMILPAKYADVIRGLAGGGGGSGGGDTFAPVIYAMDGRSVKQFMAGPGGDAMFREWSMRRRGNRAG